jgi:hypothetical protein
VGKSREGNKIRAKHESLFTIQVRAPVLLAASEATMFQPEDDMMGGADFNQLTSMH